MLHTQYNPNYVSIPDAKNKADIHAQIKNCMYPPGPYLRCPRCFYCADCNEMEKAGPISEREARDERLIKESLRFDEDKGKYVTKLPFISSPESYLADNYLEAHRRYVSTIKSASVNDKSVIKQDEVF